MSDTKKILVPVDFSFNSIQAFEFAKSMAKKNTAMLYLLHVLDPLISNAKESVSVDFHRLLKQRVENAQDELKKFIDEIPHPDIEIVDVLKVGKPNKEILNFSHDTGIDLIVIASHGWTGFYENALGRTAKHVMNYSDIPVICYRVKHPSLSKSFNVGALAENWFG
jgi:nucleotide-binding universal stress UspA family protein